MPAPGDWAAIARASDPDEIREQILTGYKAGKPFTPYEATILLPQPLGRVLDFGCGLGRNFPYLSRIAARVEGFDLPPMIEQCRRLPIDPAIALHDDWQSVRSGRYDLIFASLVLQHIDPAVSRSAIEDFARMAPHVYVLTRAGSDFGPNVLASIDDLGIFEVEACVEVDHDPATHQLRVLGRPSPEQVRTLEDGGHFEVLLMSRVFRRN